MLATLMLSCYMQFWWEINNFIRQVEMYADIKETEL